MPAAPDPNYDLKSVFLQFAPGAVWTRDMESGLAAAYAGNSFSPLTGAQVLAVIDPLMTEGNPPQYTPGPPPAQPILMPGASPVIPAALPPGPVVATPIDGNPALGTVPTFAKGLKRFVDSNPDPRDGWAIDHAEFFP